MEGGEGSIICARGWNSFLYCNLTPMEKLIQYKQTVMTFLNQMLFIWLEVRSFPDMSEKKKALHSSKKKGINISF